MTHHPDCGGYRTEHRTEVVIERKHGAALAAAVCDECGPIHQGSFGPAAHDVPKRLASEHAREVECDGRCRDW